MADRVTLYSNPMSRGRTVQWLLDELGAPYDLKVLDLAKSEQKAPEYLAINPMGKVPAIVHRGVVVTEAAAICVYLADAFPQAGLAPKLDDPKRGTYLRWIFFGVGCFEPAVMDKMFGRPPFTFISGPPRASLICCGALTPSTPGRIRASAITLRPLSGRSTIRCRFP